MSSVKVLPPVMASSKWWYQCWMPAVGWPAAVAGWGDVAWRGSARRSGGPPVYREPTLSSPRAAGEGPT
jgi:hypothetical protein